MGSAGRETGAAYGAGRNLKFFASLFFKKATGVARGETPARIWSPFKGSVADRHAFGDLSKSALCGRPGWPQFCFAKTERTCCKNVAQLVDAGTGICQSHGRRPRIGPAGNRKIIAEKSPLCAKTQRVCKFYPGHSVATLAGCLRQLRRGDSGSGFHRPGLHFYSAAPDFKQLRFLCGVSPHTPKNFLKKVLSKTSSFQRGNLTGKLIPLCPCLVNKIP